MICFLEHDPSCHVIRDVAQQVFPNTNNLVESRRARRAVHRAPRYLLFICSADVRCSHGCPLRWRRRGPTACVAQRLELIRSFSNARNLRCLPKMSGSLHIAASASDSLPNRRHGKTRKLRLGCLQVGSGIVEADLRQTIAPVRSIRPGVHRKEAPLLTSLPSEIVVPVNCCRGSCIAARWWWVGPISCTV